MQMTRHQFLLLCIIAGSRNSPVPMSRLSKPSKPSDDPPNNALNDVVVPRKRKAKSQALPLATQGSKTTHSSSSIKRTKQADDVIGIRPDWDPISSSTQAGATQSGLPQQPKGTASRAGASTVSIGGNTTVALKLGNLLKSVKNTVAAPSHMSSNVLQEHNLEVEIPRRTNGSKRFTNADLPIPHHKLPVWRRLVIPRLISIIGCHRDNPWTLAQLNVVDVLQGICDERPCELDIKISPREAAYDVAMQRVYEWRSGIAKAAVEAVAWFFDAEKENFATVDARAACVQLQLGPGLPFRYMIVEVQPEGKPVCSGIFQSPLIIQTLAHHFASSGHLVPYDNPPFGALALVTAAVERALRAWESGTFRRPDENFSQETYGHRTCKYLKAILDLKESTWAKICQAAEDHAFEHSKVIAGDFNADADQSSDEDRAMVFDDSD
ncbi:hypothetical protein BDW22DRAFT_1343667 [Trametopsis cervina]|nr:hypothetical protein BDW22DRAFT_1343667 [Trametopsis cervina]